MFDSGVGGLSVAKEIRALLPTTSIHYLMDSACFPYGQQDDDFLLRRIVELCRQAVTELGPELLVVACNTASTLALEQLRAVLPVPVIGVVPAIKTAAEQTSTGHIGLLATEATVKRSYIKKLIEEFAPNHTTTLKGSNLLVELAEKWLKNELDSDVSALLRAHLDSWLRQHPQMDAVVLGCTHFPLLKAELQQLWPDLRWIDSGDAIARRVKYLLSSPEGSGGLDIYSTAAVPKIMESSDFWSASDPVRCHPRPWGSKA